MVHRRPPAAGKSRRRHPPEEEGRLVYRICRWLPTSLHGPDTRCWAAGAPHFHRCIARRCAKGRRDCDDPYHDSRPVRSRPASQPRSGRVREQEAKPTDLWPVRPRGSGLDAWSITRWLRGNLVAAKRTKDSKLSRHCGLCSVLADLFLETTRFWEGTQSPEPRKDSLMTA